MASTSLDLAKRSLARAARDLQRTLIRSVSVQYELVFSRRRAIIRARLLRRARKERRLRHAPPDAVLTLRELQSDRAERNDVGLPAPFDRGGSAQTAS
jgi:hypothetical protein